MNQDPFSPKYGVTHQAAPQQPQYGGLPVGTPKKGLNTLLIPFVLSLVFLLFALCFAIWAFAGMQDYKNNVDQKIATATTVKEKEVSSAKEVEFLEREKSPLKTYQGPAALGTVTLQYPKTWSAYIKQDAQNEPLDGYFHPNYVPGTDSKTAYALRVKVINQSYDQIVKKFDAGVKSGKIRVAPFSLKQLPSGIVGSRVEGEVTTGQQVTMIVFPLRDKTLEISTELPQHVKDLDTIILPNLTFIP